MFFTVCKGLKENKNRTLFVSLFAKYCIFQHVFFTKNLILNTILRYFKMFALHKHKDTAYIFPNINPISPSEK